jgi:hypothetical protein
MMGVNSIWSWTLEKGVCAALSLLRARVVSRVTWICCALAKRPTTHRRCTQGCALSKADLSKWFRTSQAASATKGLSLNMEGALPHQ